MSAIADLITALRHELAAADETVLTSDQLRTAIKRGLMFINRDFETSYAVDGENITPDLTAEDQELLLLSAIPTCCGIEIAKAARRPSFKAGNVSVDRSRAVGAWRELLKETRTEYRRLTNLELNDRMSSLQARLFERGVDAGATE